MQTFPWWKRLSLLAYELYLAVAFLLSGLDNGAASETHLDPKGVLQTFCYETIMVLYFGYPARLFAFPAVLFLTTSQGGGSG